MDTSNLRITTPIIIIIKYNIKRNRYRHDGVGFARTGTVNLILGARGRAGVAKRRRRGGSRGRPPPPDPVILLGRGNSMGKIGNQFSPSKSTRPPPWKSAAAAAAAVRPFHSRRPPRIWPTIYIYTLYNNIIVIIVVLVVDAVVAFFSYYIFHYSLSICTPIVGRFTSDFFFCFYFFDFCYAAE